MVFSRYIFSRCYPCYFTKMIWIQYWWISLKSNDYYWPEARGPGINPLSLRAGPVVLLRALSSLARKGTTLAWKGTACSSTVTGQAFGAVQDVSCKWSFSILIPTVKAFTQFTFLIEITKFNSVEFVLLLSLCTTCLC